jgi:hypothetical protein
MARLVNGESEPAAEEGELAAVARWFAIRRPRVYVTFPSRSFGCGEERR